MSSESSDDSSILIQRLEELKGRDFHPPEVVWPEIVSNLRKMHEMFRTAVDVYIRQAGIVSEKDYWPPYQTKEMINWLSLNANYLRTNFLAFFQPSFRNQLYHYLYINNLLKTIQIDRVKEIRFRFIIIPTGRVSLWPLRDILISNLESGLEIDDPIIKESLERLGEMNMFGFEIDPEEPFDRQCVLVHEIFHIAVFFDYKKVNGVLQALKQEGLLDNIYATARNWTREDEDFDRQILELVCDYLSAIHMGPAFGRAFLEEILFSTKKWTKSHPPPMVRIQVILDALRFKDTKNHPYVRMVEDHYKRNREFEPTIRKKDVKSLRRLFERIMQIEGMNIERYKPPRLEGEILNHIRNKIPYLYKDIRDFLNNLPQREEISEDVEEYFDDIIMESIRKTIMYYKFKETMHKEGYGTLEEYHILGSLKGGE